MEKAPVVTQPKKCVSVQWMTGEVPDVYGCPIGLEHLTQLDKLVVKQEAHFLEVLMEWECANKYSILNSLQQQVFYAAEESDLCMRQCWGPQRGFVIHITDDLGQEVVRFTRQFKCCGGCCCCARQDCAAHEVKVQATDGTVLGYVRQLSSSWKPHLGIFDGQRRLLFESWGPCCPCQTVCCTSDVTFPFYSMRDGTLVATISKQWAGAAQELFTDADNYGVSFPVDMEVKIKAVLLGAVFLIIAGNRIYSFAVISVPPLTENPGSGPAISRILCILKTKKINFKAEKQEIINNNELCSLQKLQTS